MRRRRRPLDAPAREAIGRVLGDPVFEVLPLASGRAQVRFLPPAAIVSVTSSPSRGLAATVAFASELAAGGFRVVPHIAARMVRDRAELRDIVARLADAGIGRLFVPAGDAREPGEFPDGLSLLRALAELDHPFREIGVPCYPQGHPFIPDDRLLAALAAKAEFATFMTTQLCFDPEAIDHWILARRGDGLALPINIGLPGVAPLARLISLSARIGVGDSARFLGQNRGLVGRLLRPRGFRPDDLLADLAPTLESPPAGVLTIHLYTFNQVATTEAWRQRYLDRLGPGSVRVQPGAPPVAIDSRRDSGGK